MDNDCIDKNQHNMYETDSNNCKTFKQKNNMDNQIWMKGVESSMIQDKGRYMNLSQYLGMFLQIM